MDALGDGPTKAETHCQYGRALVEASIFDGASKLDEAIAEFQRAEALWARTSSPDRKQALRGWADALLQRDDFDGAVAKLREALALDPTDADTYHAYSPLAWTLINTGRFEKAVQFWSEVVAIGQRNGARNRRIVLRDWGFALAKQNDYDAAAAKLREALELDPSDPETYRTYNFAAQVLNRFEDAARLLAEAVTIGEQAGAAERRVALIGWGRALAGRDQYETAVPKLDEALALDRTDPASYEAYNEVAQSLARANRFDDATRLWAE